ALVAALLGCSQQPPTAPGVPADALGPLRSIDFVINDQIVTIELAIKPSEMRQGLMYRESMLENHGMLFIYNAPQYMSYWMKNTKIPLSIAFVREDGVIGNIEDMEPHTGPFDPVKSYRSKYKCLYALEMNQGWFERRGLKAGDKLSLPYDEIENIRQAVLSPR
ncbi:DUF192 domain-containing protein, partial [bacterium]|nr:DUF192 domain-containing protein [bacterium]